MSLNIPNAVTMNRHREAALTEIAARAERRKAFTHTLRRRVFSDTIVAMIENSAKSGQSRIPLTYQEIRTVFMGADFDPSCLMVKFHLLEKVLQWSQEDPNAWSLDFMDYDITTVKGRLNCANALYDMAFDLRHSCFMAVIADLAPEFEAAGYFMEYTNGVYFLSGW